MNLSFDAWATARLALRARAEAALDGHLPLAELLSGWPVALDERAARALVSPADPPETEDLRRLLAWAVADAPDDGAARTEAAWDALALARPGSGDARDRRIAALCLLARLGSACRLREHEAAAARGWAATEDDEVVRSSWCRLLDPPKPALEGEALRRRFQATIRASVLGVATVLRLPHELGVDLADRAIQQLDLVFPLARGELAAWVVETAGEPIGALTAALGPGPRQKVRRCVESRALWVEVRDALNPQGEVLDLASGTAALILRRLSLGLAEGRAAAHELGPPGWGVVRANRSRIRGRLRMAAAQDPQALSRTLRGLDALTARTATALGRFAWGWAWREARSGFGFTFEGAASPPCVPGAPAPRLSPLRPEDLPAIQTLLLLVAGRGCWADLERWVEGEGRGLGRGFYRCLDAVPEALLDPVDPERRSRGYERLRSWLSESGLDEAPPLLERAAAAVAPLSVGRDLRARMREALSPLWDESAIDFPQHHLPGVREGLLGFSSAPPRRSEGSPR